MSREPQLNANVERIGIPSPAIAISEELDKLTGAIRQLCPPDAIVRFEYDGTLRVHIYVRQFEETVRIEATLPSLAGGIFHEVRRGLPGNHSFSHRVSAVVMR
jgi:hypothetical protein